MTDEVLNTNRCSGVITRLSLGEEILNYHVCMDIFACCRKLTCWKKSSQQKRPPGPDHQLGKCVFYLAGSVGLIVKLKF